MAELVAIDALSMKDQVELMAQYPNATESQKEGPHHAASPVAFPRIESF